jgi:hypothetical protein
MMNQLKFFKALVMLNGLVPLLVLAWDAYHGQLGANSVNYALHVTGILSLLFLFLSLLMTPLRWITGWGGWIAFRRALGLYGFFYSVIHVGIYVGLDRAMDLNSTLDATIPSNRDGGRLLDGSTRRDVDEYDDPESRAQTLEAASSFSILGGCTRSDPLLSLSKIGRSTTARIRGGAGWTTRQPLRKALL